MERQYIFWRGFYNSQEKKLIIIIFLHNIWPISFFFTSQLNQRYFDS